VKGLLELSVMVGALAGAVAYVCAYDRARLSMPQRQARRLALAATPGPVVFYLALGTVIAFAVPYFVRS
jgi:3-methyladenine DNA glycosylase Mpg